MTTLLALLLLAAPANRPGYLGFAFTMHSDGATQWLVVRAVVPDSPAARAGLATLDVITAIDGKPLRFRDDLDLLDYLARVHPGQRLRLSVIHNQKKGSRVMEAAPMSDEAYERWQVNREVAKRKRATSSPR